MYRLIVHADDFGLSERVNEGILQAHRHGILTSTSLMANAPAFEQAVKICQAVATLDVGIHLTLVEEPPLLSAAAVPSLVGAAGKLHPHARVFTKKYFRGQIRLREVRDELEAQIKRIMSHGVSISHLDSHQHVHMLPDVLRITVELATVYGIPAIRLPYERVQLYMLEGTRAVSRICQLLVLNTFCRLGRQTIPLRTDYFHGFFFGGHLHTRNLQQLLRSLPPTGTGELMCHPGADDPDTHYGHWGYHWSDELAALINPEVAELLGQKGVQLISYRQLACV
jgi:hopanoid biosynthesis associated protein HpnK